MSTGSFNEESSGESQSAKSGSGHGTESASAQSPEQQLPGQQQQQPQLVARPASVVKGKSVRSRSGSRGRQSPALKDSGTGAGKAGRASDDESGAGGGAADVSEGAAAGRVSGAASPRHAVADQDQQQSAPMPLPAIEAAGSLATASVGSSVSMSLDQLKSLNKRLLQAASMGQADAAREAIQAGAAVTCANEWGRTPLQIAAQLGNLELAALLLAGGANVNRTSVLGWTALHAAAEAGHAALVDLLLSKGARVNEPTQTGWTALHWAATGDHLAVVESLLASHADPNARTVNGWTPLHLANGVEVVRRLLQSGALPNLVDDQGEDAMAVPKSDAVDELFAEWVRDHEELLAAQQQQHHAAGLLVGGGAGGGGATAADAARWIAEAGVRVAGAEEQCQSNHKLITSTLEAVLAQEHSLQAALHESAKLKRQLLNAVNAQQELRLDLRDIMDSLVSHIDPAELVAVANAAQAAARAAAEAAANESSLLSSSTGSARFGGAVTAISEGAPSGSADSAAALPPSSPRYRGSLALSSSGIVRYQQQQNPEQLQDTHFNRQADQAGSPQAQSLERVASPSHRPALVSMSTVGGDLSVSPDSHHSSLSSSSSSVSAMEPRPHLTKSLDAAAPPAADQSSGQHHLGDQDRRALASSSSSQFQVSQTQQASKERQTKKRTKQRKKSSAADATHDDNHGRSRSTTHGEKDSPGALAAGSNGSKRGATRRSASDSPLPVRKQASAPGSTSSPSLMPTPHSTTAAVPVDGVRLASKSGSELPSGSSPPNGAPPAIRHSSAIPSLGLLAGPEMTTGAANGHPDRPSGSATGKTEASGLLLGHDTGGLNRSISPALINLVGPDGNSVTGRIIHHVRGRSDEAGIAEELDARRELERLRSRDEERKERDRTSTT